MASLNSFHTRTQLTVGGRTHQIFSLPALEKAGFSGVARLPYSLKILLENLLRREDRRFVDPEDIEALGNWDVTSKAQKEIAFTPARVLLQDFTGVPAVVDLAAMRDGIVRLGGDPRKVNPLQPVELVIDHSVQVDHYSERNAADLNAALEFTRNKERYTFLRWGQEAFDNFRVVPPDTGIVHQVNLEYLARVIFKEESGGELLAYPDTLVGTDSHTTMVNGLGVVGWGVGGIEAEAAMLGQPISMLIPEVVGFRLVDRLPEGATATDLVLTITERLRKLGVVGKFVEFYGPGLEFLTIADRATLGNMSPEYGATIAICPIDEMTLDYLRLTGRDEAHVQLVEAYAKEQGLFWNSAAPDPVYTTTCDLDLSTVEPSLAGPKRPQDRVSLRQAKYKFQQALEGMIAERKPKAAAADRVAEKHGEDSAPGGRAGRRGGRQRRRAPCRAWKDWTTARWSWRRSPAAPTRRIPSVMIGAGLLARNAVKRGLKVKPWVKTSLAPGSLVVTEYLKAAGLLEYLAELGLQHRRLRLHHLHRQQRPAARAGLEHRQGSQPDRRVDSQRQPELRGADPEPGARQLPRVAAARRRLRDRRQDAGGPHDRADRRRQRRRAGDAEGDLAERARDPGGDAELGQVGDVPRAVRRMSSTGTSAGVRCRFRPASGSNGPTTPPTSATRRSSRASPRSRRSRATSPARGRSPCSATASRPITSRRPARSPRTARPDATWCQRACPRRTSTRMARGAATTR